MRPRISSTMNKPEGGQYSTAKNTAYQNELIRNKARGKSLSPSQAIVSVKTDYPTLAFAAGGGSLCRRAGAHWRRCRPDRSGNYRVSRCAGDSLYPSCFAYSPAYGHANGLLIWFFGLFCAWSKHQF